MKKVITLFAAVLALTISAQEKNLVRNGKMQAKPYANKEKMPENCLSAKFPGWGYWNAKGSKGRIYLFEKAGAGFDDNRALLARGFKRGTVLQQIQINPSGKYRFSLLCKYAGKATVTIGWHKKTGHWGFHKFNRTFQFAEDGGKGWKKASGEVTAPAEAYGLSIMINLRDQKPQEDCFIDNVCLTEVK